MKTLVLYDSITGNTEKIADTIYKTLKENRVETDLLRPEMFGDTDFFEYDIVFIGSGVIDWLPTENLMTLLRRKLKYYSKEGKVLPSAPILPGKFGVCFCTFSGPHIGIREALPMTMWLRCFFEHIGYTVLEELHYSGEFHNRNEMNASGRYGDISGRPDARDLEDVKNKVQGILRSVSV